MTAKSLIDKGGLEAGLKECLEGTFDKGPAWVISSNGPACEDIKRQIIQGAAIDVPEEKAVSLELVCETDRELFVYSEPFPYDPKEVSGASVIKVSSP